MENTDLTTEGEDLNVNGIEPQQEADQVADTTTELTDQEWNDLDINDTTLFEEDEHPQDNVEAPAETTSQTDETIQQEASDAFMQGSPVLNYKGKDIPIDNPQELIDLAQKGFKLETEMSNIKPQKKILNTVNDVPIEVLQAVADLHGGKPEAMNYLQELYGTKEPETDNFFGETADDKPTSGYIPEVKHESKLDEFWSTYSEQDVQGAAKVSDIYAQLEPSFKTEVYKDDIFPSFVQSVITGEFDNVYPLAIKEKSLNPAVSWMQAYAAAASKGAPQQPNRNEPPASAAPANTQEQGRQISDKDVIDRIWNDDDYFQEVENKVFNT